MALTVTKSADPVTAEQAHVVGDRKWLFGTVTLDNSYVTGGYAVTAALFGFETQLDFLLLGGVGIAGAKLVSYDQPNSKIKVFSALGTEAANASDQSAVVLPFVAIGK